MAGIPAQPAGPLAPVDPALSQTRIQNMVRLGALTLTALGVVYGNISPTP